MRRQQQGKEDTPRWKWLVNERPEEEWKPEQDGDGGQLELSGIGVHG